MYSHAIARSVASLFLASVRLFAGSKLRRKTITADPAVQLAAKPIGKVVTAAGSVTLEHVNAIVIQATVSGQAGQTKVGDPVYWATWSRPVPMAGSASTSPMQSFNLSSKLGEP